MDFLRVLRFDQPHRARPEGAGSCQTCLPGYRPPVPFCTLCNIKLHTVPHALDHYNTPFLYASRIRRISAFVRVHMISMRVLSLVPRPVMALCNCLHAELILIWNTAG